ncbi:IPTL-CTERM sorting domain-containing protein [Acidovorax sp. YS12]|nr:IPTL-CTERM sorting domain-containing protein [Acidovorax sp. YS12]
MTFNVPGRGAANADPGTVVFTFTSTSLLAPTVTNLSATSGPAAGGTPVTITGTNFSGATAVKFGNNDGTSTTVVNSTMITTTAPAGTGTVDVTVTTSNGTSATSANSKFTYVPAATYTVTYYGNGYTGGSVPTDGNSPYSSGSTVTVLGNTGSLARSGYTFNGWNTAANGSGTNYDPDSTFTISGNTEFYARWQLIAAPVANAVSATVAANSSNNAITLNITGGTPTSVAVASGAGHGTATASGTSISYTPTNGYSGNDSFTYTATNVGGTSVPATVSITVNPQAPVANAVSATVAYNSSANPITLNITGGTPASVAVASGASHGTATASGTSISYTPTNGYSGNDSFTYTATNAGGTSVPATVSITVNPQAPVANAVSATVAYNSSNNAITLNITGGTPASVAVASGASHGTATASGTSIIYTPTASYTGNDSFTYTATNAGGTSAPATVTITVNPQAPVANAVSATVAYNSSANPITLNITGGTPTSVAVASGAGHGTATASGTSITYTPTASYTGNDSFTYTATNAAGTSAPATVTITVNPQAPVANAVSATVAANSSNNAITLNITGGTPTSVAVASGAGHGTATASGTSITYTPTASYTGNDSFTYTATNAGGTSAPATVTITVNPQAPVANAVSATVAANSSNNAITLNITGGTPTSVAVASGAGHGTATASGTGIIYTPTNGYSGSDSFTYTATNAGGTSAPATVTITVNAAVPGAPTIGTATAGDQQASVTFTAPTDTGSAPITGYEVTVQPGGTKVSGTASPITVPGLTNGQAYTFTVAAKNSAGTGAASSPSNSVTPKMGQTITFAQPASQRLDATPTLAATASSGLAVAFSADAATLAVCEITSGGTLAFHTAGACTIHADQAGDGQYLAAPRVSRTFNVQTAAPGAPTNVVATPGDTQARVAFTPPVDAGTSPITGYTVTVQPGGATVAGTASPIVVPGLTNGVAYTFTVTATNAAGTGAASSPSNSVTPKGVVQGTVPTPTSGTGTTGTATASTAALSPAQDPNCRLAGAQFAGEVPPGFTVSYGSFEFLATDCQHGVTISLTYPQALPQGVRFMKFGPPSFGAPDEWMDWTSQVQLSADRKTATYSVLDNGAGDSDPRVGLIADPIIPAGLTAPGPSPDAAKSIPTLGEWALALLAALLGLLGWRQGRARAA